MSKPADLLGILAWIEKYQYNLFIMELYDKLIQKEELYHLLSEAEDDFKAGNAMDFQDSIDILKKGIGNGTLQGDC